VNDDEHSLFLALRIGYCYVAYNMWNKTSVNDDEHSLFLALRIGYCYVAYNVWNKTSESIFQKYEASVVLNKYVMGVWSYNFTAAFSLL